jgi:hypothetical protein
VSRGAVSAVRGYSARKCVLKQAGKHDASLFARDDSRAACLHAMLQRFVHAAAILISFGCFFSYYL